MVTFYVGFCWVDPRPGVTIQCDIIESSEASTTVHVFSRKAVDVHFFLLHIVFAVSLDF